MVGYRKFLMLSGYMGIKMLFRCPNYEPVSVHHSNDSLDYATFYLLFSLNTCLREIIFMLIEIYKDNFLKGIGFILINKNKCVVYQFICSVWL